MKAIRYDDGPETLHLAEVPDPEPGPGEVVIDVAATA
ncbi:MAG TPA: NAD(P)H-quinone oxidoreductase, partial [Actinomyces sp.]|nr:NAD(P)H-quinone oxidoreductase [Actinomyces sp.]